MNGSLGSGMITISGCSGTAVPGTGGSSMPLSIAVLANGGNVDWVSGAITHFAKPALVSKKATHCPGYVKSTKKAPYSGPEPSLDKFSGAVTVRQLRSQGSRQVQGRHLHQFTAGTSAQRSR